MNDEKGKKATLEVISFNALANVPIFSIIFTLKVSQQLCNQWKICLYHQVGEVGCMQLAKEQVIKSAAFVYFAT